VTRLRRDCNVRPIPGTKPVPAPIPLPDREVYRHEIRRLGTQLKAAVCDGKGVWDTRSDTE